MTTMSTAMLQTPDPARSAAAILGGDSDIEAAWDVLRHLESTYPGFGRWYWGRVVPGLASGTRRIFVHTAREAITGVVIAKRGARERKLCTVWVAADARGMSVAGSLVEEASEWLGHRRPLLTVPEERLAEFLPLARRRDYELTEALPSFYRERRTEYVFNGRLRPDVLD